MITLRMAISKAHVRKLLLQFISHISHERNLFPKSYFQKISAPFQVYPLVAKLHKWSPWVPMVKDATTTTILNVKVSLKKSDLSTGFLYRNPKDFSKFAASILEDVGKLKFDMKHSYLLEAHALFRTLKTKVPFELGPLIIQSTNERLIMALNKRVSNTEEESFRKLVDDVHKAAWEKSPSVHYEHIDRLCNKPANFMAQFGHESVKAQLCHGIATYLGGEIPEGLGALVTGDIDRSLALTASPFGSPKGTFDLFELQSNNKESKLLLRWVDEISDAVAKRFVRKLNFYIIADDEETECYTLGGKYFKEKSISDKETCQTINRLNTFLDLLRPLPQNRKLLMEMILYDSNTPMDYQPPLFKPSSDNIIVCKQSDYLEMEVGIIGSNRYSFDVSARARYDPKRISSCQGSPILDWLYDGKCRNVEVPTRYQSPQDRRLEVREEIQIR